MEDRNMELCALRGTLASMVGDEKQPDLTARQMCVALQVYIDGEAQTVRGLASRFNISKPAVTRALDRLGELDIIRRKVDPNDRRSVLVVRTLRGAKFIDELRKNIAKAREDALSEPA